MSTKRDDLRKKRKLRIRGRVNGTPERPRMTVFRSARHIYAQVVDDVGMRVLCGASSQAEPIRGTRAGLKKIDVAKLVGKLVAERCKERGIEKVVFDRNGYLYHGRVAALAAAAREAGLKF